MMLRTASLTGITMCLIVVTVDAGHKSAHGYERRSGPVSVTTAVTQQADLPALTTKPDSGQGGGDPERGACYPPALRT